MLLSKSGAACTFGEDAVIGTAPPVVNNIDTLDTVDEYVAYEHLIASSSSSSTGHEINPVHAQTTGTP